MCIINKKCVITKVLECNHPRVYCGESCIHNFQKCLSAVRKELLNFCLICSTPNFETSLRFLYLCASSTIKIFECPNNKSAWNHPSVNLSITTSVKRQFFQDFFTVISYIFYFNLQMKALKGRQAALLAMQQDAEQRLTDVREETPCEN